MGTLVHGRHPKPCTNAEVGVATRAKPLPRGRLVKGVESCSPEPFWIVLALASQFDDPRGQ
jgi:hypothetical protein